MLFNIYLQIRREYEKIKVARDQDMENERKRFEGVILENRNTIREKDAEIAKLKVDMIR